MHTSVLAGSGPVFRFDGSQVRVWVDDSVIAPAGRSPATLVMVDNSAEPDLARPFQPLLRYRRLPGLFGRGRPPGADRRLRALEGNPDRAARDRHDGQLTTPVWDAADPAQALLAETDNPTRVFLLSSTIAARSDVGARQGPFGSILKNVRIAPAIETRRRRSRASSRRGRRTEVAARRSAEPAEPETEGRRHRSDAGQSGAGGRRRDARHPTIR